MLRPSQPSIRRRYFTDIYMTPFWGVERGGGNCSPCFNGGMNNPKKAKSPICLCGCGGHTKGGRFLPGHDAKLKKVLLADARLGKKRAVNKLEKLGWSNSLQPIVAPPVADGTGGEVGI